MEPLSCWRSAQSPSLNGPEITLQVATANKTLGGFVTLTASQVYVRIGAGSGSTYTQRNFAGAGVTNFDPTKGAQFNAQLTDATPPGQNKGAIGAITAISGSVSCGDKTPGGGTITINGDSTGGAVGGPLTSMLVSCPTGATFALINTQTGAGGAGHTITINGDATC